MNLNYNKLLVYNYVCKYAGLEMMFIEPLIYTIPFIHIIHTYESRQMHVENSWFEFYYFKIVSKQQTCNSGGLLSYTNNTEDF